MSIRIKLFGLLADTIGKPLLELNGVENTDSLKQILFFDYPGLKNCQFIIAVDKKIIKQNQKLNPGDEVALLPPFAGG